VETTTPAFREKHVVAAPEENQTGSEWPSDDVSDGSLVSLVNEGSTDRWSLALGLGSASLLPDFRPTDVAALRGEGVLRRPSTHRPI
jgi:hypothetical protein